MNNLTEYETFVLDTVRNSVHQFPFGVGNTFIAARWNEKHDIRRGGGSQENFGAIAAASKALRKLCANGLIAEGQFSESYVLVNQYQIKLKQL